MGGQTVNRKSVPYFLYLLKTEWANALHAHPVPKTSILISIIDEIHIF